MLDTGAIDGVSSLPCFHQGGFFVKKPTVVLCLLLVACGVEDVPRNEYWKDGILVRFRKEDHVYLKPFNYFVMDSVRALGMETVKPAGYEASCTVSVLEVDVSRPNDILLSCDDYYLSRQGKSSVTSRHFSSEEDFIRGFSEFVFEIGKNRTKARR